MNNSIHLLKSQTNIQMQSNVIPTEGGKVIAIDGGHGQAGVAKDFYAEVAPEVCLWCTPKWLWENDAGKGFNTPCYKTVEVRGWMDEIGTVKKNTVDMNGTQEHIL